MNCPLCKSSRTRLLRKGIREDPDWPVYKCTQCQLQFIEQRFGDLKTYYQEEYRLGHESRVGQHLTPEQRFEEQWQQMWEVSFKVRDFIPKGSSILEIGCSSGALLDNLNKAGYDVYGLEWNPEDAAYVRDVGGLPCEESSLEECYPGKTFDAIVHIAVFEHQPDPLDFLKKIRSRLKGGGYMYFETPNVMNALLTAYDIDEYKDFFYTEPHLTYWMRENVMTALQATAFEAKISIRQRYGIANHINWMLHREPMKSGKQGMDYLQLVPKGHPLYGIMSRTTGKLDKEFRLQLVTLLGGDTIAAACRRRDI